VKKFLNYFFKTDSLGTRIPDLVSRRPNRLKINAPNNNKMELLFGNQITEFRDLLSVLQKSVDTVLTVLDELNTRVTKLEDKLDTTHKKFEACADGFYQVRDACTLLREELAEASGTLIEATYHGHNG